MKSTKKIILFILLFSLILLKPNIVFATSYSVDNFPTCVNDGKCVALCGYENRRSDNKNDIYSIYIYYDLENKKILMDWSTQPNSSGYSNSNDGAFGYNAPTTTKSQNEKNNDIRKKELDNGRINYAENTKKELKENGICPKNGYVEPGTIGNLSEICFDSGNNKCKTDYLTSIRRVNKFKGSSKLKYDYQYYIKAYFEGNGVTNESNFFKDYKCDDFLKDYQSNNIKNKIATDISNNYFHSYPLPDFVENSELYNSEFQKIIDNYNNQYKAKCIETIQNDDSKTDEQKKQEIEGFNSVSEENIQSQIDEAKDLIKEGYRTPSFSFDNKNSCNAILTTPVSKMLTNVMNFIKFVAPLLVVVFTIIDLVKSVLSGEVDNKKIWQKFIKRLIAAILIFFVVGVVQIILRMLGITTAVDCFNVE